MNKPKRFKATDGTEPMSNPQNKETIRTAEEITLKLSEIAINVVLLYTTSNLTIDENTVLDGVIKGYEYAAQFQPSPVNKEIKEGETNPYKAKIEKRIKELEAAKIKAHEDDDWHAFYEINAAITELKNILKEAKG